MVRRRERGEGLRMLVLYSYLDYREGGGGGSTALRVDGGPHGLVVGDERASVEKTDFGRGDEVESEVRDVVEQVVERALFS